MTQQRKEKFCIIGLYKCEILPKESDSGPSNKIPHPETHGILGRYWSDSNPDTNPGKSCV